MTNILMQMESQEGNCLRFHHLFPSEKVGLSQNSRMLDNRKHCSKIRFLIFKIAIPAEARTAPTNKRFSKGRISTIMDRKGEYE
jgi:hypothetical protein